MMSEELEKVRKHILDEIMEEIHIDRMLDRMRREPDRIVVVTNGKRYVITVEEESQLTARNQAAEAMGVLGKLVNQTNHWEGATLALWKNGDDYRVMDELNDVDATDSDLIEAVLMAGGE